jgi:hypothetical protein
MRDIDPANPGFDSLRVNQLLDLICNIDEVFPPAGFDRENFHFTTLILSQPRASHPTFSKKNEKI